MARKQGLFSIAIDFVMSHTVFYMRFQEKLELQQRIDSIDDERRKKMREKERIFFKKMAVALVAKDLNRIEELLKEFKIAKEKDYKEEDYLESWDDEAREINLAETADALKRSKRETSTYQIAMIEAHKEVI